MRNRVEIHYCYPGSEMADKLRGAGFYVTAGHSLPISPLFKTVYGAEGFCRNNGLEWESHGFAR